MKIWIDVLTPKQLLFSESIIDKLSKKHEILCTSRKYREVSKLAKIRKFQMISIGNHGGIERSSKLKASLLRMKKLEPIIKQFSPDLTISFCSPEAARISFGLGIRHIAFCDSPHATSVMKLTIPLIQKLLIPWIISKKEFSKFGIEEKNIIHYKAIDASVIIKRKIHKEKNNQFKKSDRKNILIRLEEEEASYALKSNKIIPIIDIISKKFYRENIIILGRYESQIKKLQKRFGSKISVLKTPIDGKILLQDTDVFIGSGGTMTAESALLGIPTISYNAIPNIIERFLVKKSLVIRENNHKKIIKILEKIFNSSKKHYKDRASKVLNIMEDPIERLIHEI